MKLAAIENVVRVIFPLSMMREGELLPAAFKLREQQDGPEKYLSVFRQFAASFNEDILQFDKGRNLPCCILNVGEVNGIELTVAENIVNYEVRAVPTNTFRSHGGIFIRIGGIPLEGSGAKAFEILKIGEEASFLIVAIRRRLMNVAQKRMTAVGQLLNDRRSKNG